MPVKLGMTNEELINSINSDPGNVVTLSGNQTISGSKRFTQPSTGMSIELTADTNQQTVPTTDTARQLGLYRNATYSKGDGYTSWLHVYRGSDGNTSAALYMKNVNCT